MMTVWLRISSLRRPLATTARAYSAAPHASPRSAAADFDAWLQQTPTRSPVAAETVRDFLGVATMENPATLSLQRRRDVVATPDFVAKIRGVIQWSFQAWSEASRTGDDARLGQLHRVLEELMPWGNMAKGDVWQHFYIRQFFLSRAPLETFLTCYEIHRNALATNGERVLPLPAALLLCELCWRGRFDEALAAYTQLELNDKERRSFTALLFEYEQYETLRKVYALQDEIDATNERETPLLDPLFILQALKELRLRDELMDRFESLPHEDQGRPEIQKLLGEV